MDTLPYPIPATEEQRLYSLAEYHLMDTPETEDFDRLAKLAARLFKVPIVLISLLARDRQYFKAHIGVDICETSREVSFCAHVIVQDDVLFIPDALLDPRFHTNPLVLGPPYIRFYAGKPLVGVHGEKLGTVCLIDTEPRSVFTDEDRQNLSDLAALVMDRMEMRRLEYIRSISQSRFENIAATSPDAIICSDVSGRITFWNGAAKRLFGYSQAEIIGQSATVIIPDSWRAAYDAQLEKLRRGEGLDAADQSLELSALRRDGTEFPAEYSLSTWVEGATWEDADTVSVGAIVRDMTERRQNEERLFKLASMDPLTDLSNRIAWESCLDDTLAAGKPAAVLLLDLDGFKEVNDRLGHWAGDMVLKEVAVRLRAACPQAIILARIGGDEFVALLGDNDPRDASAVATRLVDTLSKPYEIAGQLNEVGVSIGVALAPSHGETSIDLLGAADLALYKAKAAGKGCARLFTPAYREVAIARRSFEVELRRAFENDEFVLFYQPQVTTRCRTLTGAEALMRWRHPERGLLSPASFIDVLSQKRSAAAVGEWVLRTACRDAVRWRAVLPDFRISVNLFEAQLRSGRLLTVIKEIMADTGLPADAIELELVENILLRKDSTTLRLLHDLRDIGVGLAFDDYGTGFASLSLLKRYPVSRLKIDRTFVRDVIADQEDAAVVKAILYLGRSFGLKVIAEGVETEAQMDFLMKNRCAEAQGYLFGKPVPADDFHTKFVKVFESSAGPGSADSIKSP